MQIADLGFGIVNVRILALIIMKKDLSIIAGLVLLIAVIVVFGQGFSSATFLTNNVAQGQKDSGSSGIEEVSAKTLNVRAKVARSASARKKGLSDRDSLALDEGMLFVFDSAGEFGIWMKKMKFAIDIIWISEEKKIVDIVENAPPEPGKKDKELSIYRPKKGALYILEVNAGLSRLHGLMIGDEVRFNL